ncbi:MAG: SDR family oxidoreductase, partial [Fimbriimonadaceae bacterium]|nr:SDR family oxidoreductase [Fimbriimonadaceae bacterium]
PLAAESVAAECRTWGQRAAEFEGDLSQPAAAQAMVDTAVAELGGCDILVNNAGGMLRGPASGIPSSMTPEDLQFTLEINFHSAVYCCQAALPLMRQAGWGRIINVSSQAGVKGVERGAHYAVAKSAVVEYTRCLALEVGPQGINVNCLVPALIWSSRARAQFPDRGDAAPGLPLRRIGEPEDCAKVVEFFATDLSDYVTGQCLAVCGGALLFAH